MALLLMDGADVYSQTNVADANFNAQVKRLWLPNWSYSGTNAVVGGRLGVGNSFAFFSDGGNWWNFEHDFGAANLYPTVIIHMGWLWSQTSSHPNCEIWRISDANHNECCHMFFNQTSGGTETAGAGQLIVRNGSGINIATFVPPFATIGFAYNTWYTLELKIVLGSGTNGSVEMHVEGNTIAPVTGVNTVGTALTTGMRYFSIGARTGASNWNSWQVDDVFLLDTSGTRLNNFTGPRKIRQLLPNAAGTYTQLALSGAATNFAAVNEQGLNSDTSYVYSATVGQKDSYRIQAPASAVQTVEAIQVSGHARKDDVAARSVQPFIRTNVTDQLVGASTPLLTDYSTPGIVATMPINPVTGNPWTVAELTALEAGIQVTA